VKRGALLTARLYWLTIVEPTIRPRTCKRYREYLTIHVMPALGTVSLAKLSPQQIQTLYAAKLSEGLSTTSVNHLHAMLHDRDGCGLGRW
jgi:hypothetical protein